MYGLQKKGNSYLLNKYPQIFLTRKEEYEHFLKYQTDKNEDSSMILVCSQIGIIVQMARRFLRSGIDFDDLLQEGILITLNSLKDFDVSLGNRFSTMLMPRLRRIYQKYSSSNEFPFHVTASDFSAFLDFKKIRSR